MAVVTGDRYLEKLVKFVEEQAGPLIEGTLVLKLNPAGFRYVQSRLEALQELESLLSGAPVDYLRAYVSDLGDHRALEQLRRILRLLTSLKVVSVLPPTVRDPTPLSFVQFGRLKVLELRGCDLSTSAAKGLLELRHTLEKIICHNSTDALRHIFASRISEIRDSPPWNRLSFASCACNGLVLMDESLQLLPAVETLDLSCNKFTKVDNLRKCTKLRHLDLGFNHLRTIESLNKVSRNIVKLVLRNNALTTLCGIENLKSLEGLDVSYNIISKFSELAYPASLPSLQNLWLEGNPLCCGRWYRPKVFSFFTYPEKLKLDDKEIGNREVWKRKLLIASKNKQPSSYGFYSPAKLGVVDEGSPNRKKEKVSRLALIESEEENTSVYSDQESVSCDNDIQNREEHASTDNEAEIVDLMNRVELMKKEHSVLWLREFKEWMNHSSDMSANMYKDTGFSFCKPRGENYSRNMPSQVHPGDGSRYASGAFLALGDESGKNSLQYDNSYADESIGSLSHHNEQIGPSIRCSRGTIVGVGREDNELLKSKSHAGASSAFFPDRTSYTSTTAIPTPASSYLNSSPLSTIHNNQSESHSVSTCPVSPPHYQEDILQRRHNLVEEILQLSAESYSVASSSSDSNTSGSETGYAEFEPMMPEIGPHCKKNCLFNIEEKLSSDVVEDRMQDKSHEIPLGKENGTLTSSSCIDWMFKCHRIGFPATFDDSCSAHFAEQGAIFGKEKGRKAKKRVVSLEDENNVVSEIDASSEFKEKQSRQLAFCLSNNTELYSQSSTHITDDVIRSYFIKNIADSRVNEACCQVIRCNCLLNCESVIQEREVALLFSSHRKFYVLLISFSDDRSGIILTLWGVHMVEEVRAVVLGMGLQVVRLDMEDGGQYIFITRFIGKSRILLEALQVVDCSGANNICFLKSLEQVQLALFEKLICGGLKLSIYQYGMVLVQWGQVEDESWSPRSLFVIGDYVLLCIEDLVQLESLSFHESVPPYFRLDMVCSITDIAKMVIESGERKCVTLVLERVTAEFSPSTKGEHKSIDRKKITGVLKWKLRWFSEDDLLKFVALLKAIHAG